MDASGNLSLLAVSLPFRAAVSFQMGQTPGKWLFGLSVHQKDGSLLTRSQAFERLVKIFYVGEGYAIPVLQPVSQL